MPLFSVIIPLYNKADFIENTLKSVLQQSFVDFELIVINDGSTDESETKVLHFNDVRIRYFSKENEGVSIARNFGIEKATSKYITFLDADDYWYPDFLVTMHNTILLFETQKVFAAAKEIETSKKIAPSKYSIPKSNDSQILNYFDASHKESIIWTSCAVFHKSVFEKVGVFDPQIKIGEDTDLWIRVGLVFPVVFNPKVLARYTYDEKSVSRNDYYIFEERSFLKFEAAEKENLPLKKFLDLNRFSVAIKYKLLGNSVQFKKYNHQIGGENLTLKKRILLRLPSFALRNLIAFKQFLFNRGLGDSVFR